MAFSPMAWFFRVAMGVAAQAVMFNVPGSTLADTLCAGLIEMGTLGSLYGIGRCCAGDKSQGFAFAGPKYSR